MQSGEVPILSRNRFHPCFAAAKPARRTPRTQRRRSSVPVPSPVGGEPVKEQGAAGRCSTNVVPRRDGGQGVVSVAMVAKGAW